MCIPKISFFKIFTKFWKCLLQNFRKILNKCFYVFIVAHKQITM